MAGIRKSGDMSQGSGWEVRGGGPWGWIQGVGSLTPRKLLNSTRRGQVQNSRVGSGVVSGRWVVLCKVQVVLGWVGLGCVRLGWVGLCQVQVVLYLVTFPSSVSILPLQKFPASRASVMCTLVHDTTPRGGTETEASTPGLWSGSRNYFSGEQGRRSWFFRRCQPEVFGFGVEGSAVCGLR